MLQPEVFRHFPSSEIPILPTISCRQNQQASWTPAMNLAPRRTYECVAVLKNKQRGRSLASSASEGFTRLHHRTSLEPKRFLHHIQTPMPSPSRNLRKRILASIPNSDAPQRPATAATNPNQNKPAPPPPPQGARRRVHRLPTTRTTRPSRESVSPPPPGGPGVDSRHKRHRS